MMKNIEVILFFGIKGELITHGEELIERSRKK